MGGTSAGGTSAGSGGAGPPHSLIANGDFAGGDEGWNVTQSGGPVTIKAGGGKLCVEAGDLASKIVIGWPYGPYSPLTLEPGVPYTFSVRAVGTRVISFFAKLGEITPPYSGHAALIAETAGSWQTFTTSFSLNSGSQSVGVAIEFLLGPLDGVCIDDVIVTSP